MSRLISGHALVKISGGFQRQASQSVYRQKVISPAAAHRSAVRAETDLADGRDSGANATGPQDSMNVGAGPWHVVAARAMIVIR